MVDCDVITAPSLKFQRCRSNKPSDDAVETSNPTGSATKNAGQRHVCIASFRLSARCPQKRTIVVHGRQNRTPRSPARNRWAARIARCSRVCPAPHPGRRRSGRQRSIGGGTIDRCGCWDCRRDSARPRNHIRRGSQHSSRARRIWFRAYEDELPRRWSLARQRALAWRARALTTRNWLAFLSNNRARPR
jgi:hypothetical protein